MNDEELITITLQFCFPRQSTKRGLHTVLDSLYKKEYKVKKSVYKGFINAFCYVYRKDIVPNEDFKLHLGSYLVRLYVSDEEMYYFKEHSKVSDGLFKDELVNFDNFIQELNSIL